MATTVDTLLVRIEADMSELKKSLDKVQRDVDKSSQGIAGAFRKIGTAMKAAVAAVLVREAVRGGAAMINLASDIEEMQGKSKVVFGAFRDQVVSDLEAFGDAVGRSTFELEGMASSIQDTFVPMGFARGEAAKLSVELTKLAVDVASFNNASDTETMEAFQSALVGNHETVRRFGVVITQATLDQELMRMGIEKGVKTATNAEKVQARLNLITRGTSDAHGDAARTADSFANQMRALKAQVSELAGELGTILLPAATAIIGAFIEGTKRAKEFLQSMGILAMPIDQALISTRAEIEATQAAMDNYKNSIDSTNKAASEGNVSAQAADLTVIQEKLDAAQKKMNELIAKRNELTSKQLDITQPTLTAPPKADGAEAPETDTVTELDKEIQKLKELRNAKNAEFKLERNLKLAIAEGNKEKIKQAHFDQILYDLKKQFPEITDAQITKLTEQARAEADLIMKEAELTDKLDAKKDAQDAYNASVDDGLNYVLTNIRTNQELEETLKDLKAAYDAGKISMDEFKEAQDQIQQKINELDPAFKDLQSSADRAFNTIADTLTDMVMKGKFDLDSLKNVFKQTIKEMIADAIKAQIIKPILSGIFSSIGGSITGPLGTFISGIGQSAGGSRVQPNKPRLVGERGPELIVPQAASTVMNNHDTRNALGGGAATIVNQTINVETGVSQTVRAEMMSLLPRFKQDTMAAVVDAKRRGGSYGSAFG